MLCTPLTRMAQYAAFVAAIITLILPPQSLVCRHCLLHGAGEFVATQWNHTDSQVCHSCESHCSESNTENSQDDDHSKHDCPCCHGNVDTSILQTASSTQLVQNAVLSSEWLEAERVQPPLMLTSKPILATLGYSPSLPKVLRI